MSKVDELFAELKRQSQTAFMPFVTAGDPHLEWTAQLIPELDRVGCHLIELGFPYSDPIADGPVIQESYTRALKNGITVDQIFAMTSQVTPSIQCPIVAMVSFALIFRYGLESFIDAALKSGISGAIVPDLPVDESHTFSNICRSKDFSLVQLITPTTSDKRAVEIASTSSGFIYYVSVAGITGERTNLPPELSERLTWLKTKTNTPICVGFGISQPEQAQMLKSHADGIIVGSAIIKRIAAAGNQPSQTTIEDISKFASRMTDSLSN
ncbi:MAG: tryptophan synthase subunit alpha [Planctomycetota bacterium]